MEIMTCDQEWSHEELYGVAYDECMKACRELKFLLDNPSLVHPDNLMGLIMAELDEDKNLVDYYDEMYMDKGPHQSSDDVSNRWDVWMQDRIKSTLQAHKYKYYAKEVR